MKNEKIEVAARALNRAGLVCINPPPRFLDEVLTFLIAAGVKLKRYRLRPACPERAKALACSLEHAARRLVWFADFVPVGLTIEQAEELKDVAADLRAAAATFKPTAANELP